VEKSFESITFSVENCGKGRKNEVGNPARVSSGTLF
jgi:hypothetical protein